MKYRFARPCIILLCFALMVCQSKAGVHDELTVARALHDRGDFRETIATLKRIVMAPSTSTTPAEMAILYNNVGWLAYSENKPDAAFDAYQKALQFWIRAYGVHDYKVGETYIQLGKVYLQYSDVNDADSNIRKGMDILKRTLGDNNPITLSAMVVYSRLLDVQGQHEQAAQLEASAERSLHGRFGTPCTACDLYGRYPHS